MASRSKPVWHRAIMDLLAAISLIDTGASSAMCSPTRPAIRSMSP